MENNYSYEWIYSDTSQFASIIEERKRCAKLVDLSPDAIRLMAGEMTEQEMRTVQAILRGLKFKIEYP